MENANVQDTSDQSFNTRDTSQVFETPAIDSKHIGNHRLLN